MTTHTSVNSAPGQVILKGTSSVKVGYPPLFAEMPLQTSSSPPTNTNSSLDIVSPNPAAELLQPAPRAQITTPTPDWKTN